MVTVHTDGRVVLRDLGSLNGTLVNKAPLQDKVIILPKDIVCLGARVKIKLVKPTE